MYLTQLEASSLVIQDGLSFLPSVSALFCIVSSNLQEDNEIVEVIS